MLPDVYGANFSDESMRQAIQREPTSAGSLLDMLDKKRKSDADYRKTMAGAQKDETESKMKVADKLGNEAFWLSQHPKLSPEMVGNYMKKIAANGLQDVITPIPFQAWGDPEAARTYLAGAGNAFYEIKDRIAAEETQRSHLVDESARAGNYASEAERRKAETSIGWANAGVARDRLAYEKESGKRPTIQADADGNLFTVNPVSGTAKPVTLEGGAPMNKGTKAPTEAQANAILFGTRAIDSDKALLSMQANGFDPNTKTFARDMATNGRLLTNWMTSEAGQQYLTIGKNFTAAALRRESGAAINEGEWKMGQLLYIPMPGDKQATLQEKAHNRQLVIQGLKASVGERMSAQMDKALSNMPEGDPQRTSSGAITQPNVIQGLDGIVIKATGR
jgi:hypothetical protein